MLNGHLSQAAKSAKAEPWEVMTVGELPTIQIK
jgi:hypothetical protein